MGRARVFALLTALVFSLSVHAQWSATSASRIDGGLRCTGGDTVASVSVISPEVVRVRMTMGTVRDHSYAVVSDAASSDGLKPVTTSVPVYRFARDLGECVIAHAVARRLDAPEIAAAAQHNLEHAPSLEEWSFA